MLLTIISFVVVLGILVFVHELGHFLAARRFGVNVEEFGFGFPPRMLGVYRDPPTRKWVPVGRQRQHAPATIYSLNWIPVGGFVRIKGEQAEAVSDADSFAGQAVGRRILIISAGVAMNVVAAIGLLSLGYAIGFPTVLDETLPAGARVFDLKIQIVEVMEGSPAAAGGVQAGDVLATLDGSPFTDLGAVQEYTNQKAGAPVRVQILRDGKAVDLTLVPKMLPETGRGGFGVKLIRTGLVRYPPVRALISGFTTTYQLSAEILQAFAGVLVRIVQRQAPGVAVSGPVGIAVLSGEIARMGFPYLLQFTALLSLNLAIINFLPFPALDGGRVLFLLIERFRGRAVSARLETLMHNIGFMLLMVLVLLITYQDIVRLFLPRAVT